MIEVHAISTASSVPVPIAMEELALEYDLKLVNIRTAEPDRPDHVTCTPYGKIPVLVDPEGPGGRPLTLTESGAILVYLAEKTGRLIPFDPAGRMRVFEQMFSHLSGIGPAFGQLGFFKRRVSTQIPLAITRFQTEAERALAVLDRMLDRSEFTAGDNFTIADIMHFGWLWRREFAGIDLAMSPNVERWYQMVVARPAVSRALDKVTAFTPPQ